MEKKPKIRIGEIEEIAGVTVSVHCQFDYEDQERIINFPVGTSQDEIERCLKQAYEQYHPAKRKDYSKMKKQLDW